MKNIGVRIKQNTEFLHWFSLIIYPQNPSSIKLITKLTIISYNTLNYFSFHMHIINRKPTNDTKILMIITGIAIVGLLDGLSGKILLAVEDKQHSS